MSTATGWRRDPGTGAWTANPAPATTDSEGPAQPVTTQALPSGAGPINGHRPGGAAFSGTATTFGSPASPPAGSVSPSPAPTNRGQVPWPWIIMAAIAGVVVLIGVLVSNHDSTDSGSTSGAGSSGSSSSTSSSARATQCVKTVTSSFDQLANTFSTDNVSPSYLVSMGQRNILSSYGQNSGEYAAFYYDTNAFVTWTQTGYVTESWDSFNEREVAQVQATCSRFYS